MASSILVTGGTAMLPGFIPRLHAELLRAIEPPALLRQNFRHGKPPPPAYDRYGTLRPLIPYFAILNNPSPKALTSSSERANANAGKAPAFSPAVLAWIGGSLAGCVPFCSSHGGCGTEVVIFYAYRALKTGGAEIAREKWDEAFSQQDEDDDMDVTTISEQPPKNILPDWTRTPLSVGAPSVAKAASTQAVVGA